MKKRATGERKESRDAREKTRKRARREREGETVENESEEDVSARYQRRTRERQ